MIGSNSWGWFRNPINSRPCLLDAYPHAKPPPLHRIHTHIHTRNSLRYALSTFPRIRRHLSAAITVSRVLDSYLLLGQRSKRKMTQPADVLIPPPNGVFFPSHVIKKKTIEKGEQRSILIPRWRRGRMRSGLLVLSSLSSLQQMRHRLGGPTGPPNTNVYTRSWLAGRIEK